MRPAAILALAAAGCVPTHDRGFASPEPADRIEAIREATAADDRSSIPDLISQLDSDDPAVRMFAIRALEDLTGQTLGYRHEDPEWRRRDAIDRWAAWAREQGLS